MGTQAHAYARTPERVGASLSELVQQSKSAHREFAAASVPAPEENAAPTVWCVWQIPLAAPDCTSATPLHRYLYAYANPTIYVDSHGRCAEPVTFTLCAAGLSAVIGWAGSAIHDEWTTGVAFATAATNPRNIRNGVAVGGIVASGGMLGIRAPAGLGTIGFGTDVAMQMNLEGKVYDQVDYERSLANGGITAGSGALLGVGLGSANAYLATGSKVVAGGLAAAGAAQSGQLIGEGVASGDYGKIALGTGLASFSVAGGMAMARHPLGPLSPRMNSTELDASLNALQSKIGGVDPAVVVENPTGGVSARADGGAASSLDQLPKGVEPYQLKLFPAEAYARHQQYGNTPTAEQRASVPPGMEFDHNPMLVQHCDDCPVHTIQTLRHRRNAGFFDHVTTTLHA
ncbi:MAG: hypothetical protein ABIO49_03040 [Dokdonella sp.]